MKAIKCYFISLNSILLLFGLCSIIAGVVAVGGFTMDEWPKELNDMLENEYIKIKKIIKFASKSWNFRKTRLRFSQFRQKSWFWIRSAKSFKMRWRALLQKIIALAILTPPHVVEEKFEFIFNEIFLFFARCDDKICTISILKILKSFSLIRLESHFETQKSKFSDIDFPQISFFNPKFDFFSNLPNSSFRVRWRSSGSRGIRSQQKLHQRLFQGLQSILWLKKKMTSKMREMR